MRLPAGIMTDDEGTFGMLKFSRCGGRCMLKMKMEHRLRL